MTKTDPSTTPSDASSPHVSLVVPAHNEEGNLDSLVETLVETMESDEAGRNYELVIVNDNSRDRTGEMIDGYAKENPRIRAVHRTDTPGFGNAVKAGLAAARGEIIIPVMADLSEEPKDVLALVRKMDEGYDIAYGSRFCPGGKTEDYPPLKMFFNRFGNHAIRLMFGLPHLDVTNAFKAYRREVLHTIGFENLKSEAFDLTIEIPLKAHILGFKSVEVPVSWKNRTAGEAKLKLTQHCHKYGMRLLEMFVYGNIVALKDLLQALFQGSFARVFLSMGLGVGLLATVFYLAGWGKVTELLGRVSPIYILASIAVLVVGFALRTWRWSVLLRSVGHRVERGKIFSCLLFGWFLNYLLPARVGDVARGMALKTTDDKPMSIGLVTVLIERAMDMLVMAFLLTLSLSFLARGETFSYLALLALGGGLGLVVLVLFLSKYDYLLVKALPHRLGEIKKDLATIQEGMTKLWKNPISLLLCFLLTFPVWFAELASLYLAALALGLDVSAVVTTASGIVAFLSQAIPTVPAGLGVHEGAVASVWKLAGLAPDQGTTVALVDHFARAVVIYTLGAVATIHVGFQSRNYFRRQKEKAGKERSGEEK